MNISSLVYINLDHRKDRLNNITKQLQHCPYSHYRISGVLIDNPLDYCVVPRLEKNINTRKGAIGCFKSHIKSIEKLISLNQDLDQYSIILEDDVYIHPSFWSLITNLEVDLRDADVILCDAAAKFCPHGTYHKVRECYPVIYQINKTQNAMNQIYPRKYKLCFWGTHCVILHNQKLKFLLDMLNNIDQYMNIDIYYLLKANCFVMQTGLTYQQTDDFYSDIPRIHA